MTVEAVKKWKPEEIRFRMERNNEWLCRGLLAIYRRQTADERSSETTNHENGVGFNGADANILTKLAKHYETNGWFSKKQYAIVRERMPKYAGQLARIANKEP